MTAASESRPSLLHNRRVTMTRMTMSDDVISDTMFTCDLINYNSSMLYLLVVFVYSLGGNTYRLSDYPYSCGLGLSIHEMFDTQITPFPYFSNTPNFRLRIAPKRLEIARRGRRLGLVYRGRPFQRRRPRNSSSYRS